MFRLQPVCFCGFCAPGHSMGLFPSNYFLDVVPKAASDYAAKQLMMVAAVSMHSSYLKRDEDRIQSVPVIGFSPNHTVGQPNHTVTEPPH